ncbi:preprotein translocase subunit YidC [Blastomyces dermatitidis ER-3]|uniref:Preprotein translocase subunit YidC n=3 Tax=Blastomyces TaxID=229219 RepID=A0A179UA73_BLAGS|nr:preprotein translocase subunit YidC [Blastomyces gilchristii SLH14081]XP_045276211.1 preprotein translocase subunit YidC [Blastomyces dermatitidis ER-3]EGE82072.2 preprotein translocase subunit YidC [Blastomyces dermatitidis ATCC 18188]EQL33395.1 preprotein translocase subunit YidC [Blastomyces dermatitidis ATCC 26199]EEQ89250.1 preprotein translocase subunit YidC [Blastomyces dermatitidis ER-3]OAT04854.1 preprotein translocase subunit YidC [Blastomyces gilchristii SLH14081]
MASGDDSHSRIELYDSALTLPSDSENYSANNELSSSPLSSSSSPIILYKPPTFWGLLRGAAINLLLPFVNGLMLGFGELLAHEAAFRLGWSGTKAW